LQPFFVFGIFSAVVQLEKRTEKAVIQNPKKLITLPTGLSSMLRFLLIVALGLYILSKIGGFFFRIGAASQNRTTQYRKPGNINVDKTQKKDKRGTIKGGDYVDYEEVK
jgi:hypothetical protein